LLVLVVEDNPLNAKILTTLLRRAGLEYIEAKDGRQAVDLFERHRPRVVLLDINMPIMNGFEACQAMRRLQEAWGRPNEAHTIIAVTALSSEADKLRGQEAGVDEWHTKPLRLSGLVAKLQRWR
ncbi:putative response regulator recevier domain protein, partial [Acaromyces ingoldii]